MPPKKFSFIQTVTQKINIKQISIIIISTLVLSTVVILSYDQFRNDTVIQNNDTKRISQNSRLGQNRQVIVDPHEIIKSTFELSGINSSATAKKMIKRLQKINGVRDVTLSDDFKTLSVHYVRGKAPKKPIVDTVKKMGYEIKYPQSSGQLEVLEFNIQFQ